jgi:tRNA nucleotidyltransferase (CCA-adding enzyme)
VDLITTHLNADFDGLASMIAARKLYPDGILVFPGGAQKSVRDFLATHDLGLTRLSDVDMEKLGRLVLVDTQDPDRIGPLKAVCLRPDVDVHIYDHHPDAEAGAPSTSPWRVGRRVIEPVGATVTVLVEQLQAANLPLTAFEATVLAIGLYEETGFLSFVSTTPRDLEAAAHVLRAGADLTVVSDVLRAHLDPGQIALLSDLLQGSETYYLEGRKILLATSAYDRYHGDLAEVVHKLAEMEGFDAVIVAIAMDDKIEIIGRSRRPEIDVGRIAREFGGGGHSVAASATVKNQTLVELRERLTYLVTERYRPTLLARDVMTTPVMTIGERSTVAEAEASLTKYGVNVLPVLNDRGRYAGLVTRETIQKALFHRFGKVPVAAVRQTEVYTADPLTPFREVESRMLERNQRFVPILQGGRVVGVITRTDMLRTLHDDVGGKDRIRGIDASGGRGISKRNVRGMLKDRVPPEIFARLQQAGEVAKRSSVQAYLVGGFVRDLLLGRTTLDVDIAVEGDGIAYARALAKAEGAHVKAHDRFGTAVLVFPDGFKLDVATARTEFYEYPTALPTVERSSIKKDLYRRDFTINTLAVRLNADRFGDLIDFYGGQHDLNEKTIRVLHSLSFVEDPTRVFRAVRFEQRFGFRLGKETLSLIKGAVHMDLFHRLSGSRLLGELIPLLSEEEPRKAISRLSELDLLRFIHPDLKWSPRLAALLRSVEKVLDWYALSSLNPPRAGSARAEKWLVYLMALLEMVPARAMSETVKRLAVSRRFAEKIREGHQATASVVRRLSGRPAPRPSDIYQTLNGLADERLLLIMAVARSETIQRQVAAYMSTYQHVKPFLTGDDLKTLGLKPGPMYRKVLDHLLYARLNGEVSSEAEERCLVGRLVGRG